jgi:hypothetical protein
MTEMVERVAVAIRKLATEIDHRPGIQSNDAVWFAEEYARAAIEAMRELPSDPGPRYDAGEYSRRNQEAMVDDALGKTEGTN